MERISDLFEEEAKMWNLEVEQKRRATRATKERKGYEKNVEAWQDICRFLDAADIPPEDKLEVLARVKVEEAEAKRVYKEDSPFLPRPT